jgi:hypothetical protein
MGSLLLRSWVRMSRSNSETNFLELKMKNYFAISVVLLNAVGCAPKNSSCILVALPLLMSDGWILCIVENDSEGVSQFQRIWLKDLRLSLQSQLQEANGEGPTAISPETNLLRNVLL